MEGVPPNVPKRLVRLLKRLGSLRAVAKEREINIFYVSRLFGAGVEPADPELREKLFLPRKVRAARRLRRKVRPAWLDDLRQAEIEMRK